MNCNCQTGFFQGDDLIDIITVNRPSNTDEFAITQAQLQVGNLEPIITDNPVFPYSVSIMRNDSIKLGFSNPIYLRIIFNDADGHTNVRRTCIGSLDLKVNAQVVRDVIPTPTTEG